MTESKRKAPKTAFKKGQSGNPGGRPKEVGEVRDLAKERSPRAIETLTAIMENAKAPPAARVAAATAILDRAYGRPAQHVSIDARRSVAGFLESLGAAAADPDAVEAGPGSLRH